MLPDIILDRDGVINQDSPDYIKNPEEWHPLEGSIEAIAALKKAGHRVFVATNQSGIGRGLYSERVLHAMHCKMARLLQEYDCQVDGIYFCPHLPDEKCRCRKPLPGMLLQIAEEHHVQLDKAFYVGDSRKDLEAAEAAGIQGILVLTGNGKKTLESIKDKPLQGEPLESGSVPVFESLFDFCDAFLKGKLI